MLSISACARARECREVCKHGTNGHVPHEVRDEVVKADPEEVTDAMVAQGSELCGNGREGNYKRDDGNRQQRKPARLAVGLGHGQRGGRILRGKHIVADFRRLI